VWTWWTTHRKKGQPAWVPHDTSDDTHDPSRLP